nr:uncharacterized protein LOC109172465 [Ipomoea batatas]
MKNVGPKDKLILDYVFFNPTEEHPLTYETHSSHTLLSQFFCLTILNIYTYTFVREELFIHGGYYLSRDIFQTLRSGELESMFLDIWCLRLNQLDLNRGIDKPKRMFFSTQTFLQLDSPSDWAKHPDSGKQLDFEQCLDTEIQNVANLDISDAQLKNAFAMYLHKKGHTNLEEKVKKLTVELIKMNWRSADNKTDCELYYMRHMETYMGNPQWKCGFAPKKPNVAWTAFDVQVFGNQV